MRGISGRTAFEASPAAIEVVREVLARSRAAIQDFTLAGRSVASAAVVGVAEDIDAGSVATVLRRWGRQFAPCHRKRIKRPHIRARPAVRQADGLLRC